MDNDELTPKQQQFAVEYTRDRNGTQAAVRAGYSEKSARQQSYKLLRIPGVKNRIRELDAENATAAGIDAQDLIKRYQRWANSSPEEVAEWPQGRWADVIKANDRLAEISGLIGKLAARADEEKVVPGAIFVPSQSSRDEWAKDNGVVVIEKDEEKKGVDVEVN